MEEADRRDYVRSHREISPLSAGGKTPPIRVLVANRSEIESELLAEAIGRDRRFASVGWGVQQAEISSLAGNTWPDVLLITPKLDDKPSGGLEVLEECRISHPALKVVVLLESHENDAIVQSFRLGARGIFSKDLPLKMLIKCIVRVHEGQIWATNEQFSLVVEALAVAHTPRSCRNKTSKLSPRELQIVNSMSQGLSNGQIAQRLQLGKHTVRNCTCRILNKLAVSDRTSFLSQGLRSNVNNIAKSDQSGEVRRVCWYSSCV